MESRLLLLNMTDYRYPPVSSAYVMGALKNAGINYDFIDLPRDNIKLLYEMLTRKKYLAVAIGSCIGGYADCENIFKIIKEIKNDIITILGGRITTVCPSSLLQRLKADYLVVGDAYPSFIELMQQFIGTGRSNIELIPGIAYRKETVSQNKKSTFVYTEKREPQSLDNFYPYWHDVDLSQYHYPYQYPVVTCIGCIGRCTFCAPGVGPIRIRPVNHVINEIKEAWLRFQISRFEIISEIFYPSSNNIIEFCDCLSKLKVNLSWRCNLRIDISPEVFPLMAAAGCREIIFGVESYEDTVLAGMKKLTTEAAIQTAIEKANKHKIRVTAGLMAGNVHDTPETLRKTANFIVSNNIMVDRPSFLTPLQIYPGTKLYAEAKEKKLIDNEYKYLKDISQSLYSYLNPLQKRQYLPSRFINLTGMSDHQLEYAIEFNEWIMHKNAFRQWKLKNFNGTRGKCCYCNKTFSFEGSLRTRENAVVCPFCLAYNLITLDQTNLLNDSMKEVLSIIKSDEKIAFIGTRESAYWLTSFVSDREKVKYNWKFFNHSFLNPNSRYVCGHETLDIQHQMHEAEGNLIICDIMCPEYYINLLHVFNQDSLVMHWLVPYNYYKQAYVYNPKYACEGELDQVADDLAIACQEVMSDRSNLIIIQSKEFSYTFAKQLRRAGFNITNIIDPEKIISNNGLNHYVLAGLGSSLEKYPGGIVVLDHDSFRQNQITSFCREKSDEKGISVMSLNEFLFARYSLQTGIEGTRIDKFENLQLQYRFG